MASFLDAMEAAIADLRRTFQRDLAGGKSGFLDPILGFFHAVDWTEPWLMALIAVHLLLFAFVVKTRHNNGVQMATFLCAMSGVFAAERLNAFLAGHWKSFARQPYFDRYGVFLSTVWSGPLLLLTALILVNSLFTLARLMVQWKRAELKYRARLAQQKSE